MCVCMRVTHMCHLYTYDFIQTHPNFAVCITLLASASADLERLCKNIHHFTGLLSVPVLSTDELCQGSPSSMTRMYSTLYCNLKGYFHPHKNVKGYTFLCFCFVFKFRKLYVQAPLLSEYFNMHERTKFGIGEIMHRYVNTTATDSELHCILPRCLFDNVLQH